MFHEARTRATNLFLDRLPNAYEQLLFSNTVTVWEDTQDPQRYINMTY